DLHVRLLASGDAHHTRVSPCRLAADVIVLVRPCIAGVASSHWRLLAMLSRRDALTRDVFPIKLTQLPRRNFLSTRTDLLLARSLGRRCQSFGRADQYGADAFAAVPEPYSGRLLGGLPEPNMDVWKWTGRGWRNMCGSSALGRFL